MAGNKSILFLVVIIISFNSFGQTISRRSNDGMPPCAGGSMEYWYNSGLNGVCDDVTWGVFYEKNNQSYAVDYTVVAIDDNSNPIRISVNWPTAAFGSKGSVSAVGLGCCQLICIPFSNYERSAWIFEYFGSAPFSIDGNNFIDCGVQGNVTYSIPNSLPGTLYSWSSNGLGGLSPQPTQGQSSKSATFSFSTVSEFTPAYGIINVTATSQCAGAAAVTQTKVLSRALTEFIPNSPTFGATSYTQNTTKYGYGTITIQGDQTPSTAVVVNLKSDFQIRILPSSILKPNIILKIGIPCVASTNANTLISEGAMFRDVADGKEVSEDLAIKESNLLSIYPNPIFNEGSIEYFVTERSFVKLYISGSMGMRVLSFEDMDDVGPGGYEVKFNTQFLRSGIYYCTFTTKNSYQVKKILIMK